MSQTTPSANATVSKAAAQVNISGAVKFTNTGSLLCSNRQNPTMVHPVHPKLRPRYLEEVPASLIGFKSPQERFPTGSPNGQDRNTALAVAISGGGHRAANFAIGVLMGLESVKLKAQRNLLMEADYFSTVSGGGMAAGAFISALHDSEKRMEFSLTKAMRVQDGVDRDVMQERCGSGYHRDKPEEWHTGKGADPCLKRNLERGLHGNLFRGLVAPALTRGEALEKTFDRKVLGSQWRQSSLKFKDKTEFGSYFSTIYVKTPFGWKAILGHE